MSELAAGRLPEATADLVDLYGDALASVALPFRSFGGRARFSGSVVTLKCFEDNALLGTNPAKSSKTGAGQVDVTLDIAGVRFSPGDTVFCDEDIPTAASWVSIGAGPPIGPHSGRCCAWWMICSISSPTATKIIALPEMRATSLARPVRMLSTARAAA